MKKQDRIDLIIEMVETLSWAIEMVDAKFAVPESLTDIANEHIIAGQKWLEDIYVKQYKILKETWALRKPEIWENYELFGGFDDHAEVKLLRRAKHDFRLAITSQKRPDLFKKTKVEKLRVAK